MPTKNKRLDWAESALDELGEGIAFYAKRYPVAAQRMLKEINHAAQSLVATEVPNKGRPGRLVETRELVVGSHTHRTFWFLPKQNIRNPPYISCGLCTPPESFPSPV